MSIRKELRNQLLKEGVTGIVEDYRASCGNRFDLALPGYKIGVIFNKQQKLHETEWVIHSPSRNFVDSGDSRQMIQCFIQQMSLSNE